MRNLTKLTAGVAALAVVLAFGASSAHAEPSMDKPSTIQVDDGKGGWKPYEPKKPPVGPTGISVTDENGNWVPYAPKPKPPVSKPKNKHPKLVDEKKRGGFTYWLFQNPDGTQYIQVFDANGEHLSLNGEMAFPGTAGPMVAIH
jgi:hypothetical protein